MSDIFISETRRILICGSRDWKDSGRIGKFLDDFISEQNIEPCNLVIIHGACKGADYLAGLEAKQRNCQIVEFPANWAKFGLSAGPKRNQQMLDEGKPDIIIAFHPDLNKSKGTRDMLARAELKKIPIQIITN